MAKNKKFLFLAAFLVFALLVVLVACGDDNGGAADNGDDDNGEVVEADPVDEDGDDNGEEPDPAPAGGVGVSGVPDELVVGFQGEIPTLDPHGQNMLVATHVNRHVLETLVTQDENLEIHPNLARDWYQIDDYNWRFYLRDDVYFHNGDKMTAYDVAFSITRAAEAPMVAPIMGMIDPDSIDIIDEYTVVIGTNYPFAPFLNHLAHSAGSILNAAVMGDVPGGPETDFDLIVGTGPYQVIENIAGDRIVMERWDDWHGELPNMRLITYRIIPDPPARTIALEVGEVDIIHAPGAPDIARLESNPDLIVPITPGLATNYILFNLERPGLDDVRVRQALNYATDVPTLVYVISEGTQIPSVGFVPPLAFGHNPNFEPHPYNLERARELMIEAGFSGEEGAGDLAFEFIVNPEAPAGVQSAEIFANMVARIGVDITLNPMEFTTMIEDYLNESRHYIATLGWGTVTGDADYQFFPLFHSSSANNHARFFNDEADELIERARSSTDPNERLELYAEIQEILRYEAPWVLLGNGNIRLPAQRNVGGIVVMPTQGHFYGNIYFTE